MGLLSQAAGIAMCRNQLIDKAGYLVERELC
jgi:hypothetical protein